MLSTLKKKLLGTYYEIQTSKITSQAITFLYLDICNKKMNAILRILASKRRALSVLLVIAAVGSLVRDDLTSAVISQSLKWQTSYANVKVAQPEAEVHVPALLDLQSQRTLSLNLGGGMCKWQPPVYTVPDDIDFYKTVIAGFPSGDKRMIFVQVSELCSFNPNAATNLLVLIVYTFCRWKLSQVGQLRMNGISNTWESVIILSSKLIIHTMRVFGDGMVLPTRLS